MVPEQENEIARFWWFRRITLGMVLLILLMLLVWIAEDQYAARRLESHLRVYRVAREPVSIADVAVPSVNDDDNAAMVFQAAAAKVSASAARNNYSPRSSAFEFDYELPPVDAWMEMTRKAIEANALALKQAHAATGRHGVDWGTRLSSPLIAVMLPHLAPQRELANLVSDAAVYQHVIGDDREAIALYRVMQHQANALCEEPLIVSHLVGIGVEELADTALGQFAGELRVDDGTPGCLTREEVRQVIRELLERPKRDLRPALQVERLQILDLYETRSANRYSNRALNRADVVLVLQWTDQLIRASSAPTMQDALALLSGEREPLGWGFGGSQLPPSEALRPIRRMRMGDRVLHPPYRALLSNRVLAIQLAARLYSLDHGRYPATLEELTPEYLAQVPADPMSPAGLRYVFLADGTRPMVYSLGVKGDAQQSKASEVPTRFWWNWQKGEPGEAVAWFDISAWKSGEERLWKGPPEDPAWPEGFGPPPGLFTESVEEGDEDADHADEEGEQGE